MKYIIFLLSISALSAVAAVGKMKPHGKKHRLLCRENDYYCQSRLNETNSEVRQNKENSLSQFDGEMVKDVSTTLSQGLTTSPVKK